MTSTTFTIIFTNIIFTMLITNGCFFIKNYQGIKISNKIVKIWGVISIIISIISTSLIYKHMIITIPTTIISGIIGTIINIRVNQNLELQKNYIRSIGVILLFFIAPSLIIYLLDLMFPKSIDKINDSLLTLISNLGLALLLIYIYRKDLIKEFKIFKKDFFKNMDNGIKYWMIGLFIMMGSNLLISILVPQAVTGNENQVREMLYATPIISLISTGFLAPFIEEITFRKTFKDMIPNNTLFVLISGFIFGALHVVLSIETPYDLFYLIPYCSLGFCFGLIYTKTKTIYTSIAIHMIHNTGTVLILLAYSMAVFLC